MVVSKLWARLVGGVTAEAVVSPVNDFVSTNAPVLVEPAEDLQATDARLDDSNTVNVPADVNTVVEPVVTAFDTEEELITDQTLGELKVNQLSIVHVTSHMPAINNDGRLSIATTYDALGAEDQDPATFRFRNTVHTTLNGPVASHNFGQWDDKNMAIVAPLTEAIRLNGVPPVLNPVDTYWAQETGEPLALEKYKLVQGRSDGFAPEEFIRHQGNRVFFKSDLSDDDRLALVKGFFVEKGREDLKRKHGYDFYKFSKEEIVIDAYGSLSYSLQNQGHDFTLFKGLFVTDEAGIEEFEKRLMSATDDELITINGFFVSQIRDEAIWQAVESFDSPRRICAKGHWAGSFSLSEGITDFAESMGSEFNDHSSSKSAQLERMLNGQTILGGLVERSTAQEVQDFIEEHRDRLPEATIGAVEEIIANPIYQQAVDTRFNQLNSMIGHNRQSSFPEA